jgi:hypothetical protein
MKKVRLFAIIVLVVAFYSFATEPTEGTLATQATFENYLTIYSIYVGDYNTSEGKAVIVCTSASFTGFRTYVIDLGTDWASLAYSSAVSAFINNKRVGIYRYNTPSNGQYKCYRICLQP